MKYVDTIETKGRKSFREKKNFGVDFITFSFSGSRR